MNKCPTKGHVLEGTVTYSRLLLGMLQEMFYFIVLRIDTFLSPSFRSA